MSVAGALRAHRTHEPSTRRIGILFMIGSACFALASLPGSSSVSAAVARRIARLNLVGSIFFGISAVAGIWVAQTSAQLDASLARGGTLVGALCFFYASYLLVARDPATGTAEAT